MRTLIAALALSLFAASPVLAKPGTGPVSGPEAKAHISERLQKSSRVPDKTRPFTTHLGGEKGDTVRPFTASNVRTRVFPTGPSSSAMLHVGNRVTGTLNTKTGAVRTKSVIMPR